MSEFAALLDERDIVALTVRYCQALDERDWKLLASCFTPDAVAVYDGIPGEHAGVEAIVRLCRRALEPLDASQHLIGNHAVHLSGDRANARCYLHAQHVRRGVAGGELFVVAGTYRDEAVRTPEGWRISRREERTTWTSGNPAVLGLAPS